jgi:hypothetical protein
MRWIFLESVSASAFFSHDHFPTSRVYSIYMLALETNLNQFEGSSRFMSVSGLSTLNVAHVKPHQKG